MSAIRYPDYRLISLPRVVADLIAGPEEPSYERSEAETVDEAMRWLQRTYPDIKDDGPRRRWARELVLLRWLVDAGRVREDRP
jgi:hypothetical protein